MQTEGQCEPSQRFLFADTYFSDNAISIWQSECIKRCKNKENREVYESYINWARNENEIAVFTLYAYADFDIAKKFDIIFRLDNPKEFTRIDYELTQSIHEAWFPIDTINHGHKHLCIFSFDKSIPDILYTLHKEEEKFSTSPEGQKLLGFCSFKDFDAITIRIEKTLQLKILHGDKWWEYDDRE